MRQHGTPHSQPPFRRLHLALPQPPYRVGPQTTFPEPAVSEAAIPRKHADSAQFLALEVASPVLAGRGRCPAQPAAVWGARLRVARRGSAVLLEYLLGEVSERNVMGGIRSSD